MAPKPKSSNLQTSPYFKKTADLPSSAKSSRSSSRPARKSITPKKYIQSSSSENEDEKDVVKKKRKVSKTVWKEDSPEKGTSESDDEGSSEGYKSEDHDEDAAEDDDDEEVESDASEDVDSDDLDGSDVDLKKKSKASSGGMKKSNGGVSTNGPPKPIPADGDYSDFSGGESEVEEVFVDSDGEPLPEGTTIVRKLKKKKGKNIDTVPAGQISRDTFKFLHALMIEKNNDRQWFWNHETEYRAAVKEWNSFIEEFTSKLIEVDNEIPYLPPKDVTHRIARDIRFSNNRTPYKTNFSASFSRTGRKSTFAHYHVMIQPGGRSIVAAGLWSPEKDEVATFRNNVAQDSAPLRDVLSNPEFVSLFGEPKKKKDGSRNSVFGHESELKTAPKGFAKDHKDIDLLRLKSIAVSTRLPDEVVLGDGFVDRCIEIIQVCMPFTHLLNEMITPAEE